MNYFYALICTQCGAPINRQKQKCEHCGTEYFFSPSQPPKIENREESLGSSPSTSFSGSYSLSLSPSASVSPSLSQRFVIERKNSKKKRPGFLGLFK